LTGADVDRGRCELRHEFFEQAGSNNIQRGRIFGFSAVSIFGARNLGAV
jgi:hypothetical protein